MQYTHVLNPDGFGVRSPADTLFDTLQRRTDWLDRSAPRIRNTLHDP